MHKLHKYKNYDEYLNHQLEKTNNPDVIESHKLNRDKRISDFVWKFNALNEVERECNVLCIGSRYGEEIEALNKQGFKDVVGIDLMEYPPYTSKMDMHDLKFDNDKFSIIYTNSLDHSNDIHKAIGEMIRVVNKTFGMIIIELELYNDHGKYENYVFESPKDIIDIFNSYGVKYGFKDVQFVRFINRSVPLCINAEEHFLMFTFMSEGKIDETK